MEKRPYTGGAFTLEEARRILGLCWLDYIDLHEGETFKGKQKIWICPSGFYVNAK